MMGKITKGGSFGGCVDYVTRRKKDNPDGSPCKEWHLIDYKDVSTIEGRSGIITCLLYTSPSPRDVEESRMPSSA